MNLSVDNYLRPIFSIWIQTHDLGVADILVLVQWSALPRLVGVVHGKGSSSRVVDEPSVAGRLTKAVTTEGYCLVSCAQGGLR